VRLRLIVPTTHTIQVDDNDPTKCNPDRCVKYRAAMVQAFCVLPTDNGSQFIVDGKRTAMCLKAEVVK
jgi:hypothetical protein